LWWFCVAELLGPIHRQSAKPNLNLNRAPSSLPFPVSLRHFPLLTIHPALSNSVLLSGPQFTVSVTSLDHFCLSGFGAKSLLGFPQSWRETRLAHLLGASPSVLVTRGRLTISLKVRTALTTHFVTLLTNVLSSLQSADIISTVEFDHTGDYLATGDKGGRVVLFERNESVRCISPVSRALRACSYSFSIDLEKGLRIQVLHRISVARTRIRLSQIP
jgi:hypothetical protein